MFANTATELIFDSTYMYYGSQCQIVQPPVLQQLQETEKV